MTEVAAPAESGQGEATQSAVAAPTAVSQPTNIKDPDLQGWIEAKYQGSEPSLEQLASSYRNLEKFVGADKAGRGVVIPGPEADADTMNEFYGKLGRPSDPSKYNIAIPEGQQPDAFTDWARSTFHEAGLTDKQASLLSEKYNDYMGRMIGNMQQQSADQADQAKAALRKEWGAAYDQKFAAIDKTAEALGFSDQQLDGLRSAMGPVEALKFVDKLATKLGEDVMDGTSESLSQFTPAAAQEELSKLMTDKDFTEAWINKGHPSHQWAVEKKAALARQIAGVRN